MAVDGHADVHDLTMKTTPWVQHLADGTRCYHCGEPVPGAIVATGGPYYMKDGMVMRHAPLAFIACKSTGPRS